MDMSSVLRYEMLRIYQQWKDEDLISNFQAEHISDYSHDAFIHIVLEVCLNYDHQNFEAKMKLKKAVYDFSEYLIKKYDCPMTSVEFHDNGFFSIRLQSEFKKQR